ncbi:MAG: DUF3179 domain-containing protein [Gammaproteobacteria bacterium]|nr:DUF3179 domain-containing protein [Gammaproteobacteria bacterium]MCF6364268.1 DUF3179 domain-containing protein [Gammaproteobacteria bacterium]
MKRNDGSRLATLFAVIVCVCFSAWVSAQEKNGFDLSVLSIDKDEVLAGGPPRDGIPSIDQPKFITAKKVDYLHDDDLVIGLVRGDVARAYPTRILVWHEIVNDVIDGDAVAITYCPLCGTAMVFARKINGKVVSFGVSGLLYRSDVLMYDRESESLWSQLAMKAVSGSAVDTELVWLPSEHITWKAWREKYPHGEVLSTDTGYKRNYQGEAYAAYFASEETMFPVPHTRKELSNKTWVVGILIDGKAKAYPVDDLPPNLAIEDQLGNQQLIIRYDVDKRYPQITDHKGKPIPSVMVFWFAWQAFYPNTDLWRP